MDKKKRLKHVSFENHTRPNSGFDLIHLEELLSRGILDEITELHKVEFFHIFIITNGSGKHTIDFTDYDYQKGSLFTIRKDQIQRFHKGEDAKGYLLLFTEDLLASQFSKSEVLKSFQLFNEFMTSPKVDLSDKEYQMFRGLIDFIESEYIENDDAFSVGIIRSVLHIFVTKLFRIKSSSGIFNSNKRYLKEFLEFQNLIEERCFETKTVLDYAQLMGCTSKTLNNITRAIMDKSAKSIIDEIVVTQIKRLLINTPLSITEIAYMAGFDDPTNMYKYFKKHVDSSPEAFRQSQG